MSRRHRDEADAARAELETLRERLALAADEVRLLASAIDAVPSGLVLFDAAGAVARRTALSSIGGHEGVLLDEAVESVASAALAGVATERRLELFGPPPRVYLLRATVLHGGGALVVVDDISERIRLDAVRTDFVANISHELKTPVGGIAVLADTIADHDDIEVMRQLASRMVIEAHRAAETIDDLLELSRIELGGAADRQPVDLGHVVADALRRVVAAARQRQVNVLVAGEPSPVVVGDHRQLVTAIANLVDNAIKYSESDQRVVVDLRRDGGWVEAVVSDEGAGIPAKDLDRVFERFYRVDRARSRETGGTGLGLAIVRHVANNHGGEVGVTSREGEGSVFTLRLPGAGG